MWNNCCASKCEEKCYTKHEPKCIKKEIKCCEKVTGYENVNHGVMMQDGNSYWM